MPDNNEVIEALKGLISKPKASADIWSKWFSRKLTVGASVIAGLIVLSLLGRLDQIAAILWPVVTLAGIYLITQTYEDVEKYKVDGKKDQTKF